MMTSPITQPSLLVRLRDNNDHDSWSDFVDVYGPLVQQYFHRRKLQQADYVTIHKTFKENKPYTSLSITQQGANALKQYVAEMEEIIKTLKSG